nr:phosphatidyl-n-methylethanolamine n-methyltransferase [Quercus suber]
MTNGAVCTIGFSAIVAVITWFFSLPRTFSTLSKGATISAIFTFVSVILATIFAAIEGKPNGYDPVNIGPVDVHAVPPASTTFVMGMSAFMNISYTFIGQITIPSFIAEMKDPRDFPKALWAVTIAEVIVFSLVGAVIYAYTGTNYYTAPAFGSLSNELYKKLSFSFMIPTIIFLGVLYASVSARFIFFRLFAGTRHMGSNTALGWVSWGAILAVLWVLAFIIAEVIPFFSDLLSLMSSLFDSFFGFIFWGVAYFRMRRADHGPMFWRNRGIRGMGGAAFNVLLIGIGLLFLSAGTYASVESIIQGYAAGNFGGAFTCQSNAFIIFNPTFWNIAAQNEYYNKTITKLAGGNPRYGCYALAVTIFSLGLIRDALYERALRAQPSHPALLGFVPQAVAAGLVASGNVLVLSSMWALGVTGTYLGDYFGILMDNIVTGFPFNVTGSPMYWGSTMSFLGTALWYGKPAGVALTALVFSAYYVALQFEDPFTAEIYAKRERERASGGIGAKPKEGAIGPKGGVMEPKGGKIGPKKE